MNTRVRYKRVEKDKTGKKKDYCTYRCQHFHHCIDVPSLVWGIPER